MSDAEGASGEPSRPSVLLVEDEELVRSLAAEILAGCGFRVVAAASAGEALDRAGEEGATLDLLVTDIVLPGSSGSDLAEILVRRHPDLRVLYMSGYDDGLVLRRGVAAERCAFLQKPFSADLLERRALELLGR